jgi:hypothetical protein
MVTAGSTDEDLYKCYIANSLNINETICNNNYPYAKPPLSFPITKDDLKVLDKRYDCYKKYLPPTEAAELG